MSVLPIDTKRYGMPEMVKIFEEENRLQKMLDVEAALALAHAELGNIPKKDARKIARVASIKYVNLNKVKEIEREVKHDVVALIKVLADVSGESGKYVHLGATSSDIKDTATSLQLKDAIELIEKKMDEIEKVLMEKAIKYKHTLMIGRTHGQHALPTTFGFKLAVWMNEISRHIQRLRECKHRVLVGKMSGAVGTQASFGIYSTKIQDLVMRKLGIKSAEISTQIVQRDRYAELICLFGMVASTLENFATEIRELQRTEISEVFEPFNVEKQVGSSAMPHKKNPEICERICGLARIIRSLSIPAMENMISWHERDLTQSSAERFIIPEACILLHYILSLMAAILSNMQVDEKQMEKNLMLTKNRMMSESILQKLIENGMGRQEAYDLVRKLSMESESKNKDFKIVLLENDRVKRFLSEKEIEEALDPRKYLGTAIAQVDSLIEKTKRDRKKRGLTL